MAPGATWATKRWAPERFAALADALHADGHGLVLVAGPGDAAAAAAFRAACARRSRPTSPRSRSTRWPPRWPS